MENPKSGLLKDSTKTLFHLQSSILFRKGACPYRGEISAVCSAFPKGSDRIKSFGSLNEEQAVVVDGGFCKKFIADALSLFLLEGSDGGVARLKFILVIEEALIQGKTGDYAGSGNF